MTHAKNCICDDCLRGGWHNGIYMKALQSEYKAQCESMALLHEERCDMAMTLGYVLLYEQLTQAMNNHLLDHEAMNEYQEMRRNDRYNRFCDKYII